MSVTKHASKTLVDKRKTALQEQIDTLDSKFDLLGGAQKTLLQKIYNAEVATEAAKTAAETAKSGAESARDAANSAKETAVSKAAEASSAKTDAETAKTGAEGAKADALAAKSGAEQAKADAVDAKTLAVQAKNDAQSAAEDAAEAAMEAAKKIIDQLVRMVKVTELPQQGEPRVIYLVPRAESETGNLYDEYIWTNGAWEKIGSTDIDLSGYVEKTQKVNGKALSGDITLSASDVGALGNTGDQTLDGDLTLGTFDSEKTLWFNALTGILGISNIGGRDGNGNLMWRWPNSTSYGTLALLQNLAANYSTSSTYPLNKLCVYNKKLYRCTTAIETAEAWTDAHWTEATVDDVLAAIRSALNDKAPLTSPAFTGTPTAPNLTDQSADGQVANKKYVDDKVADATPNLDYVMRVDPETGGIYYTTPDTND